MSDYDELLAACEKVIPGVEEMLKCVEGTGIESESPALGEALATLKRVRDRAQAAKEGAETMMKGTSRRMVVRPPLSLPKRKPGA